MKFHLVFENSNDSIEFDVVSNGDLLEFFVERSNKEACNSFSDNKSIYNQATGLLNDINWSLSKTNEILYDLYGKSFHQETDLSNYFDQRLLNRQHEEWVYSQNHIIDIDELRYSQDHRRSKLGYRLHELYPDDIRKIHLAEAMSKLGYTFPYEEVNMTVHRLEKFFSKQDHEFKSRLKWDVFDNPCHATMESNNDEVNFSFGYTYVGRQYLNKWEFFDTDLECGDHYNYETLESAFQVRLCRPQTIPFSKEFLDWCKLKGVKPIADQIPVANVVDLEKNLTYYRTILYKNSRDGNPAKLIIN